MSYCSLSDILRCPRLGLKTESGIGVGAADLSVLNDFGLLKGMMPAPNRRMSVICQITVSG